MIVMAISKPSSSRSRLFVLWVPHQQLVPLDCFDYYNRCHVPIGLSWTSFDQ
ncbi:hypothetical protein HanOQP8_Chr08g0284731 [Helianthus annuus]|uniref:Uncharacterized protein n=1 Tax=Helianthus annuus TaxID=4232 RepID=A0A251SWP4_HELAN|nr:hypothetical protein HanOQP8_Chr08g0284731 [Helianthus annuus]